MVFFVTMVVVLLGILPPRVYLASEKRQWKESLVDIRTRSVPSYNVLVVIQVPCQFTVIMLISHSFVHQ